MNVCMYACMWSHPSLYARTYTHSLPPPPPLPQSNDPSGLEMRRLMWSIVPLLVSNPLCTAQIVEANFMQAVLSYVSVDVLTYESHDVLKSCSRPESVCTYVKQWSFTQLLELQFLAIRSIQQIAPFLPETYSKLVHTYTHTHIHTHTFINTHLYTYIHTYMRTFSLCFSLYISMSTGYLSIYISLFVHLCMYVCLNVCLCTAHTSCLFVYALMYVCMYV